MTITIEQKYLDFLDALLEIERRTCSFQDPEYLFEKDFWVSREYMKRKEEEISIIKITDFHLDKIVKEEYTKLDLLNILFLKKKTEKRFRRQSEIPLGENHFYIEMAHIINQSVLDALDSVGFPKPVVGIRSNWMFVNFQETSYQITNVIKLYSYDQCERIFYEILRILLPELKRIKLMKTLEEIIIFVKKSLKKKIIEEEAPDIVQEIKNDCQKLLKEKELEKNKLIKDHETKYRVLLDENKSLLEYKTKLEETPAIIQGIKNDCQKLLKEKELEKNKLIKDHEIKYRVLLNENKSLIEYKTKLEKLEEAPSTIQVAEIKISEMKEEKIVTPPLKVPKKKKITKKKKVSKKVEPKIEAIKSVEVVEEKKPVEKPKEEVKTVKKPKTKKKAKKTKKAKASKKKTKKTKKKKKIK